MPSGIGAIAWQGEIVCYDASIDEWGERVDDYAGGGTIRIPVKTGRKVIEARILGNATLLELTPELAQAILADLKPQHSP